MCELKVKLISAFAVVAVRHHDMCAVFPMKTTHELRWTGIQFSIETDDGSRWIQDSSTGIPNAAGAVTNTFRPGIEGQIAGSLWPAGQALADYLDFLASKDESLYNARDLRVLELGSGSGLVGIAAARIFASRNDGISRHVIVTDLPNAMPLLSSNCQLNQTTDSSVKLEALPLSWGEDLPERVASCLPFNLLLLADLVYWPFLHEKLFKTCLDLTERDPVKTTLLIAYRQREPAAEEVFFEKFCSHFDLETVEEEWTADFERRQQSKGDDGRMFLFRARRIPPGERGKGAEQFELMKLLSLDMEDE